MKEFLLLDNSRPGSPGDDDSGVETSSSNRDANRRRNDKKMGAESCESSDESLSAFDGPAQGAVTTVVPSKGNINLGPSERP